MELGYRHWVKLAFSPLTGSVIAYYHINDHFWIINGETESWRDLLISAGADLWWCISASWVCIFMGLNRIFSLITHLSLYHIQVMKRRCTRCEARAPARLGRSQTATRCWEGQDCRAWTEEPGRTRRRRWMEWGTGRQRRRTCRRKTRRSWRRGRVTAPLEGCWETNPGCRWNESQSLQTWCRLLRTGRHQNTLMPL